MINLIVGGNGLVGTALRSALERKEIMFDFTSRTLDGTLNQIRLDLMSVPNFWHCDYDVVYLVAAVPKFAECERDPATWRVNVDAPIAMARLFPKAFKVFISSDAVEFAGNTAYARQKAHVESYMQSIDAAIVRPSRIPPENADMFAEYLIAVGQGRRPGLFRWSPQVTYAGW